MCSHRPDIGSALHRKFLLFLLHHTHTHTHWTTRGKGHSFRHQNPPPLANLQSGPSTWFCRSRCTTSLHTVCSWSFSQALPWTSWLCRKKKTKKTSTITCRLLSNLPFSILIKPSTADQRINNTGRCLTSSGADNIRKCQFYRADAIEVVINKTRAHDDN